MSDKKQNVIERAKTARSSCKQCGGVIEKGAIRFGLVDFGFSDSGSYKYYHLACANKNKRGDVDEVMSARGDAQEVPRAEIEAALSGGPASGDPSDFASMATPPLTPDGKPLDAKATAALVGAMHDSSTKTGGKKNVVTLEEFTARLGEPAIRDFAWRVFEAWAQASGELRHKWVFRVLSKTIDDAHVFRLGPMIENWTKHSKKNHVAAGLEVLTVCGSQAALGEVERLAQRFHYKGAYNMAAQAFAEVAHQRGLSVHQLEDRLVPSMGLDASGSRTFDLGGRVLHLRVDADLCAVLEDDDKARLKAFPPARKSDDAAKHKAAKAEFDLLRTELEAALKTQAVRLELALAIGRNWKRPEWEEHLFTHPVMKHLVRRFVWGQRDAKGHLQNTFIVDEQGALMSAAMDRIDLDPSSSLVTLAHPAELDEKTRTAWATVLADFQIIQPFLQMGRMVFAVDERDRGGDALRTFTKNATEPGRLHGVLNRLGWIKAPPEDMMVRQFVKHFDGRGVTAVIEFSPGLYVAGGDDSPQTPEDAYFTALTTKAGRIPIAKVDPVAASEVLHDLGVLASAS